MAAVATTPRRRSRLSLRFWLWTLAALLGLPALLAAAVWAYGPYWIAPVDDFAQGPGGAIAYISLNNQLRAQASEFWAGADVRLEMNQHEFSGMLSSALLSGRQERNPVRKVRAGLTEGEIRVEAVLTPASLIDLPERYQGPVGLKLGLLPTVSEDGVIRFRITRGAVGRIPVPPMLMRWVGRLFAADAPGFSAEDLSIELPLGDMIASQFGRNVKIRQAVADEGRLVLVVAMPPKETPQ